jgi:hypothetical protein
MVRTSPTASPFSSVTTFNYYIIRKRKREYVRYVYKTFLTLHYVYNVFVQYDSVGTITDYTQSGNAHPFWRTFNHDGIFFITYHTKLQCTLQLKGQIHSPYSISPLSLCTLWVRYIPVPVPGKYRTYH